MKTVKQQLHDVLVKHTGSYTPEKIVANVIKQLDKDREQFVYKLMGFDKDYGNNWKVDHCNGRSGNSPVGDAIKDEVFRTLIPYINSLIPQVVEQLIEKKGLEKQIIKEIEDVFRYNNYSKIKLLVESKITNLVNEKFKEFEPQLEKEVEDYFIGDTKEESKNENNNNN